ncbi:cyclin-dependent protein kinase inhibitor SMR2-like isoform X1 [Amaranthus tricolor]|uniref:cyclin-dependent protein kinase inhibitor SMR2-like isoform X1 n=1 Tax=Amaranthus tricolor TaxID=29722 RepID=UPI002589C651|nr:cyclin-dependent protein kinase inhibitor SMR2-like isoform X1 [Amaranthus tricolor]
MAPTSKRRRSEKTQKNTTNNTIITRRIITRSIHKKEQLLLLSQTTPKKSGKSMEDDSAINKSLDDVCSTPKSEKYKIPEIQTCPPAPKKPKHDNCLNQKRRAITFFAHPDLDKFLMFAMTDSIKAEEKRETEENRS